MLELFPDTATLDGSELTVGGVGAAALAEEHGTPLLVLCEETIRARARAYREAAPEALVVYGTKAFPNVAVMRVLAEEGVGADVSTLGELRFARAAGVPGESLVVHGNNKDELELAEAAAAGGLVVLDALDELERAERAGVRRTLVRVTAGIEADTHEAIRTGQRGSKFGLPPDQALDAIDRARPAGPPRAHRLPADRQRGGARDGRLARGVLRRLPGPARLDAAGARPRRRPRRPYLARRPTGADDRGARARAARPGRAGVGAARAPEAEPDPRARAFARRAGRRDALPRRRGQARERGSHLRGRRRRHVGQPPARALRRPLLRPAREPRRRARGGHATASRASIASRATC